jgi:hypothetical protein
MDWKAFITDLAIGSKQTITFGEGASTAELDGLETEFNFRLPAQYRELMLQTNGVFGEYELPIVDDFAAVREMNREARSSSHDGCMPLDHLFFISDMYGNGDLVGYGIRRDRWEFPSLFRWDHEDDSRQWEAPDLKTWLEWMYQVN